MPIRELATVEAVHAWLRLQGARGLTLDSRYVAPDDVFFAWPGHERDARRYVAAALRAGAIACLVERRGVEEFDFDVDPRIAAYSGLKAATGRIASLFFGAPSDRLSVIACTGTNGKTSTSWWIAQALTSRNQRCGVIGTLGIGEPPPVGRADAVRLDEPATATDDALVEPRPYRPVVPTGLTTPDALTLQAAFRRFVDDGFPACVVEASSIGIAEHRLSGTQVRIAVFTNFTQDHLDYHGNMTAYWQIKAELFAWPGLRAAIINIDDERGVALAESVSADMPGLNGFSSGPVASTVALWSYSARRAARLQAVDIRNTGAGIAFDVREGDATVRVETRLIGRYNVSNLLAVIGVLRASGVALDDAAAACSRLVPVPGRMQRVVSERGVAEAADAVEPHPRPDVVIDYAHTPDALEKALDALRPIALERGGKLWCVFGCGGNRDASKRPLMGALARRLAHHVVVTSDNPRLEPPDFIISQVLAGVVGADDVDVIENRADAIRHAVASAGANDVVLVAGKGHEEYQEIGGVKLPFSDVAVAGEAMRGRAA